MQMKRIAMVGTDKNHYSKNLMNFKMNKRFLTADLRVVFICLGFFTQMLLSECPHLCECKWKSGKESVICLNANISSVPQHLEAGTQVLDLTGNNLVTVKHNEFARAGLPNLQKVYISKCRLRNLERYAFRSLINLVELDISYNVLTSIPSHTFDSIPELRDLKLSGNPITRILNHAFIHLRQLVKLELSDCKINTIEDEAFHGLERSLEWLKLDNNKLQKVQSKSITILENLHGLELANNPWNCSCTLRPLRQWMLRKNIPFGVPPMCSSPERVSSKPWDKLQLDEFACAPEILAINPIAHGVEGKNVTMACRIAGVPEPTVRWILKNKVIANLSGTPYSNGKKLYIVHLTNGSSDLTILTVDLQDAGVYVCSAENKAGRAEASVTLGVSQRPSHSPLTGISVIVSLVTAGLLALLGFVVVVWVYSLRSKRTLEWRKRKCGRVQENYEKIELNHKVPGSSSTLAMQQEVVDRRHGDYRLIPGADNNDQVEKDKEGNSQTVAAPVANGNNNEGQVPSSWSTNGSMITSETKWESQELSLLETEDSNNPRKDANGRDDCPKIYNSMSGTYNYVLDQQSSHVSSSSLSCHFMRKQPYDSLSLRTSGNHVMTGDNDDEEAKGEEISAKNCIELKSHRQLDDLKSRRDSVECSYSTTLRCGNFSSTSDVYCTLPRKISDIYRRKYSCPATESQSPLLPGSSRESGDGFDEGGVYTSVRRFSDPHKNPIGRESFKSSSYMNLVNVNSENTNTLPISTYYDENGTYSIYDYHANQLKKFLEEYRSLQKELTKMKETCENIGKKCTTLVNSPNSNHQQLPQQDNSNNRCVIIPNYLSDSCDFDNDNIKVRNS
ncbi:uncharacterized protein LOC108733145 [Agrilus planipennis]|uniref:Uncharacterized protein LOC108733145 n=1 Tax=Agrilus planipennis TaxID=224129 RepID=A0A7F5RMN0_AGRPL|nr:uncharacterized protein LOC108733145 [Agrilus planipennis]